MWLEVKNISKRFDKNEVLKDISFSLEQGKTLAILGKSGCGKTTLLKIIAGIIPACEGDVFHQHKLITHLPLNKRNIIYLYQDALLFPHLNVFENIAFGLRARKLGEEEILQKANKLISELGLTGYENQNPQLLSGGQKQRVAFGRSLIVNPDCMLLDEPFSSLDFETRTTMQMFYKEMAEKFNITTVFVTHDLKEALIMGNHFAVMDSGRLTFYKDKSEFINSPETGVMQEKTFWDNINADKK